jgi:hypothetical protein
MSGSAAEEPSVGARRWRTLGIVAGQRGRSKRRGLHDAPVCAGCSASSAIVVITAQAAPHCTGC